MAKANAFRFSTKYQDDETDLVYYGYRYYNLSTGRWLNTDPMQEQGGRNLYAIAGNNPISGFDPHGDIGLDTALDLLVLGVDLSTGAGLATIALDVAALAIPLAPNPRGGIIITRILNGEKKSFELVDRALLMDGVRPEWPLVKASGFCGVSDRIFSSDSGYRDAQFP